MPEAVAGIADGIEAMLYSEMAKEEVAETMFQLSVELRNRSTMYRRDTIPCPAPEAP
jgi:hypothetical protein